MSHLPGPNEVKREGQRGPASGKLKSLTSITESLNEGLRARRSGKSYDYLAGEGDEARQTSPKKFAYHDNAPPGRPGRSYDYMDEDQNRRGGGGHEAVTGWRRTPRSADAFDTASDDDSVDTTDREWVEEQIARNPIPRPPARRSANPGPIGLIGFGMTTVLLNLHNTGKHPLYSIVPSMGICCGGGAQLIAGLLEFPKGNTFGFVAFTMYGAFWLSLVCVWMLPNASNGGPIEVGATSEYYLGVYLIIWGFFSAAMFSCTFRMNVAIFLVFLTVTLLFFLLGGGMMAGNRAAISAAGYEGMICGSLALYLACAEITNEVWDRTVLPIIPMTQLLGWFGYATAEGDGHAKSARKDKPSPSDKDLSKSSS